MSFLKLALAICQLRISVTSVCADCNAVEDMNVMLQSRANVNTIEKETEQEKRPWPWGDYVNILTEVESMKKDPSARNMSRIKEIHQILMDFVLPDLNKSRKAAEDELFTVAGEFTICNTNATNTKINVDSMGTTTSTAEGEHAKCRTDEKGKFDIQKAKCNEQAVFEAGINYPPMPSSKVFAEARPKLENVLEWITTNLPLWVGYNHTCVTTKEAHKKTKEACIKKQASFELDFCQYRQALLDLKQYTATCFAAADVLYKSFQAATEKNVKQWKIEYKALKKIECFLKVWLGDGNLTTVSNDQYTKCEGTQPDVSHMNVKNPTIPHAIEIDASSVEAYPGTEEFLKRYENIPVAVSDVYPCMSHTTTTTTTRQFATKRCSSDSRYGSHGVGANVLYLNANQGGWPSNAFCNTVEFGSKAETNYHISVEMNNIKGWKGVNSGHIGVGWNAQDMDNYDFVYFRPHSDGGCFQTGQMVGGKVKWSNQKTASCLGGGIRGNRWVKIDVYVGPTSAQIFKDGREVVVAPNHFTQKAAGVMIVANGYKNSAKFKKINVIEAKTPAEQPTYDVMNSMGQRFSVDKNVVKSHGQFASVFYSLAGRSGKIYLEFTRGGANTNLGFGCGMGVQRAPKVIANKHSGTDGNGNGGEGVVWYKDSDGLKSGDSVNMLLIDIDSGSVSLNGATAKTIPGTAGSTLYLAFYDGTSRGTGEMAFNFGQKEFEGSIPSGAIPWCCQAVTENVPE